MCCECVSLVSSIPRQCVRWHRLRTKTLNTPHSRSSTFLSIVAKKTFMSSSLSVPLGTHSAIVCASFPLSSTVALLIGSRRGLMTLLVSCEGVWDVGGRWVWEEVHVGM